MASITNPIQPFARLRNWLRQLRTFFSATNYSFTEGNLVRGVLLLGIPMACELAMEGGFALVDIYFVSGLGQGAVAAVGLTESIVSVIIAISVGLGTAAAIVVARRIGEEDRQRASSAAMVALTLGLGISLLIALCAPFSESLLRLVGANDEIVQIGSRYTSLMLLGNGTIVIITILNAVFRGAGNAGIAMRTLLFANVVNMILDPCLIFGVSPFPALGTAGAAVATNIGRGVGILYQVAALGKRGCPIFLTPHLDFSILSKMLKMAAGCTLQMLIGTASWIFLLRIISAFDSAAIAGFTIALRLVTICLMPAWGFSNAAATLVGQNLGAKRPDRAKQAVWLTALCNAVLLGTVGVLCMGWAESWVRFLSKNPDVIRVGADSLRIIGYCCLPFALQISCNAAFNGSGDTNTPTVLGFVFSWLIQIPLAFVLARYVVKGPNGVPWAICATQLLFTVVSFYLFRQGKWIHSKV